jgi:CDGSH-type Zn-finger protein
MATNQDKIGNAKKIVIRPDGPYMVKGNIPLVRKTQIVSEYGEPLTWQKTGTIETPETYLLCRCGQSHEKPFCDGTHCEVDFNGKETADPGSTTMRQRNFPGGVKILARFDATLCMESGFCGTRKAHIQQLLCATDDPIVRAQVMAMIERCPSGALTYSVDESETDIEPDLPEQVAVTTEITSDGPIEGPLWVTGAIPIERADGKAFEVRNRVTLCNCGLSQNKPLCDGTHRHRDSR